MSKKTASDDSPEPRSTPERNQVAASTDSHKKEDVASGDVIIMPRGAYIQSKMRDQFPAKRKIAVCVVDEFVRDFDAVLLDAGSTAEMIAEEMFARRKFLSVLTNNMGAYAAYTRARSSRHIDTPSTTGVPLQGDFSRGLQGNELLITGGVYVDTYEALLGDVTMKSISEFTPNTTIIGVSGLRCEEGVFCHGAEEAAIKKLLWTKKADIRLIATDWSKIGKRDAHSFGRLEQLGVNAKHAVVVTCNPPDDEDPKRIEEFEKEVRAMEKGNIKVVRLDITR